MALNSFALSRHRRRGSSAFAGHRRVNKVKYVGMEIILQSILIPLKSALILMPRVNGGRLFPELINHALLSGI